MRVVGVDVGAKRIGLAISDPTATLARPLGCVTVAALDATAVARVRAEVERLRDEEDGVAALVVGLPRRLNGQPNAMTAQVQAFADRLGQACGLPVIAAGRAAVQPRSRDAAGRAHQGLARTEARARRRVGRGHPAGLPRRAPADAVARGARRMMRRLLLAVVAVVVLAAAAARAGPGG